MSGMWQGAPGGVDISPAAGHAILEQYKSLYEYSWFIQKEKEHIQTEHYDFYCHL